MKTQKKNVSLITIIAISVVFILFHFAGIFDSLDLRLTDSFLHFHAEPAKAGKDRVAFAVITDTSLKYADKLFNMGWPWRREYYAKIAEFNKLCGAKATIFDIIYSEKSVYREKDDNQFASGIKGENVVLGFNDTEGKNNIVPLIQKFALPDIKSSGNSIPNFKGILHPLPNLLKSADALGCFASTPDRDGMIRRMHPVFAYNGLKLPSLALAAWKLGNPGKKITFTDGSLTIGNKTLPLDSGGRIRLKYHGDNNVYYDINTIYIFLALQKIKRHFAAWNRIHNGKPPLSMEKVCRERGAYNSMLTELNYFYIKKYQRKFLLKTGIRLPKFKLDRYITANPTLLLNSIASLPSAKLKKLGPDPDKLKTNRTLLLKALAKAGLEFNPRTYPVLGMKVWRSGGKAIKKELLYPWLLNGKYIIVGSISQGLQDIVATPFNPAESGMHVHATFLDNLLQGESLREINSPFIYILLILIATALTSYIGYYHPARILTVAATGISILLIGGSFLLAGSGIIVFPLSPWIAMLTGVLTTALVNRSLEKKQKLFLHNAFGQYLSPSVIDTILKNPDRLKLGGERKEMTAFFSDLQGFSSISEKLSPEELVNLLNDYLSRMCAIISEEGGTIDKFEGDAIIAFWGAPLEQKDHAQRACRAAVRMNAEMENIRKDFREQGRPELFMRMGINTGPMVVGNMGSHQRMDYTIMGDAVNLASRLEGANKMYNTWVMIAENTRKLVADTMITREIDCIRVMGKSEPVTVFELIGEK